jgi:hypothetical protein
MSAGRNLSQPSCTISTTIRDIGDNYAARHVGADHPRVGSNNHVEQDRYCEEPEMKAALRSLESSRKQRRLSEGRGV